VKRYPSALSDAARKIFEQALALPVEDRERLTDLLQTSLLDESWIDVALERLAAHKNDPDSSIPWQSISRDFRNRVRK
jgi:hypothetical protein